MKNMFQMLVFLLSADPIFDSYFLIIISCKILTFVNSFLCVLVFYLPAEAGEKVVYFL